jgi:hypothetical protein
MLHRHPAVCLPNSHLPPSPFSFVFPCLGNLHDGALGNALDATSRFGNQRNCLFGREALFVCFTRLSGHGDKDAGVGDSLDRAPTGAFLGVCSIATTAGVRRRKRTCGVAAGGPRVRISRQGLKDGAAEPGTELAVAQGAVGLGGIIWTSEVYQLRSIDTAEC